MGTAGIGESYFIRRLSSFCRQNRGEPGIYALLRGHKDAVNAVRFFQAPEGEPHVLVSGSCDGQLRLWQTESGISNMFHEVAIVEAHASSINCLCINECSNLVISGSADASLKVWKVDLKAESKVVLAQTIRTKSQLLPLALASVNLHVRGNAILAVAGTTGTVQIWVAQTELRFELQATLIGHEGWIRCLAITKEHDRPDGDLLLASASQDKYIRLWRIRKEVAEADESASTRDFMSSLSNKAHRLRTLQGPFSLTFEALLLGHEDWIYTAQWRRRNSGLQLLSASADNSLAIWEAEESSGIWVCNTRLGEISSQKGSTTATGSTGGFWVGLWSPNGESVLSLGKTGSWRLWNYESQYSRWTQSTGISGHVSSITDIAWAKDGSYLLSTGMDQTTRLHAPWIRGEFYSWHEFARPQIHGYGLNCIDSLGRSLFVSGADEKSLRVFGEPKAIAALLERLCGIPEPSDECLPDAASIPVLGLSNKAVEDLENTESIGESSFYERDAPGPASVMSVKTLNLSHPPLEDQLARHTLWPEREKLYGHGFEISAVAASHDSSLVATACKASSINHAVIRLYETKDWREVKPALTAHSLTVTCLRFSRDDKYLLSVGRDRQWAVFERDEGSAELYRLRIRNPKGHSRMILSASWASADAGRIFATAGRDKAVRVWRLLSDSKEPKVDCVTTLALASPAMAVDVSTLLVRKGLVMAIGTEDGEILVYTLILPDLVIRDTWKIDEG